DGSLDATFGVGGKVTTNSGFVDPGIIGIGGTPDLDEAFDVALQPGGKIVTVGVSEALTDYGVTSNFLLARYNPDGTLDPRFRPEQTHVGWWELPFGMTRTHFRGLGRPAVATH